MKNTILQGKKLVKVFRQGKTESRILDGIDIEVYEKDFTVIMGPSGAGKSTLLYALRESRACCLPMSLQGP